MTNEEIILLHKATALNEIRKLYRPLAKPLSYCPEEGETQQQRRDEEVCRIVNKLENDLKELKRTLTTLTNG